PHGRRRVREGSGDARAGARYRRGLGAGRLPARAASPGCREEHAPFGAALGGRRVRRRPRIDDDRRRIESGTQIADPGPQVPGDWLRRVRPAPKVMSMAAAIAAHVHDGDTLVIEGFTHLICFAAGHEIIRQRRRDLTLCRLTPDLIYDQMIAAGCARKLVFSWAGNPGAGPRRPSRRAGATKAGAGGALGIADGSQ